ncbi:MAG TPA: DUF6519 domain-containing protein [Vicinamibacterales bacterium]|jgi:hypothetical protein
MKVDLTRDTFHPSKHFWRVLTQQGRVQLDADANEQAAILLRYLQTLANDLIGPAGGPAANLGFQISPLTPSPSPLDFQIGFGNYYVNGMLCQADFRPVAIIPVPGNVPNVVHVENWSADFDAKTIPYYEVFDDAAGPAFDPTMVQITNPNAATNQITIANLPPEIESAVNPKLRRIITYLHQPDYVFSTTQGAVSPPPLPTTGFGQIYLDVWERAITYVEDDSIREVALGGPDTSARTKLVWQVKWQQSNNGGADGPPCGTPPPALERGFLQAQAKQTSKSTNPCIINPNASYTGPENQLYRVEINRGGAAGSDVVNSATFKWSRENGSVVYPIVSGGGTPVVVVESLGRDDRYGLVEGNLVEAQDDRSVLLNLPGRLLPVQSIDSTAMSVTLGGTPDANVGNDSTLSPLLRRWDQKAGDPDEGGLTLAGDNAALVQEGVWLTLEDGVQIRFQPAAAVAAETGQVGHEYITGDFWLIPARTATGDVEWPKVLDAQGKPETDAQGNIIPVALPPHGITHYFAPLAVVGFSPNGMSVVTDCRSSFPPAAVPVRSQ